MSLLLLESLLLSLSLSLSFARGLSLYVLDASPQLVLVPCLRILVDLDCSCSFVGREDVKGHDFCSVVLGNRLYAHAVIMMTHGCQHGRDGSMLRPR